MSEDQCFLNSSFKSSKSSQKVSQETKRLFEELMDKIKNQIKLESLKNQSKKDKKGLKFSPMRPKSANSPDLERKNEIMAPKSSSTSSFNSDRESIDDKILLSGRAKNFDATSQIT